ncbi:hypothetical protein GP2_076_00060 [Gordonia paraffinivorans NBRC 108238]|uniref:Uncharacterized protein n=1 Tax=Gordonia paraffinivorans NBRC 108238 TaxID=1223543 RepID=A0ABQ0IRW9_9ACTN|nr:hypothetical protein GP2_076_00060 [Gordonia paraffinivorans NBRC 108238]
MCTRQFVTKVSNVLVAKEWTPAVWFHEDVHFSLFDCEVRPMPVENALVTNFQPQQRTIRAVS